ncbi:unnamed protein product [Pleuronectes platessa]|uniref:Uncharacterized protein n=1 Tax=Pleuronectes platessa TaxID=8262 RepID=A0A9N7UCT8_PLEPL|nr:unnamed protein product [Pleuronectes platessa]
MFHCRLITRAATDQPSVDRTPNSEERKLPPVLGLPLVLMAGDIRCVEVKPISLPDDLITSSRLQSVQQFRDKDIQTSHFISPVAEERTPSSPCCTVSIQRLHLNSCCNQDDQMIGRTEPSKTSRTHAPPTDPQRSPQHQISRSQ